MLTMDPDAVWKWAAVAAAAAASTYVADTAFFMCRVSRDRARAHVDEVVAEACEYVYTSYVRGARRDGQWDEAAKKQAMSSALSHIKQTTGTGYSDAALSALVARYLRQARRHKGVQLGQVPTPA